MFEFLLPNYGFQTQTHNSPNTNPNTHLPFSQKKPSFYKQNLLIFLSCLVVREQPNPSSKFKKPLAPCCPTRFVINSNFEAKLQLHHPTEHENFNFDVAASIAHVASIIIEQELVDEKNPGWKKCSPNLQREHVPAEDILKQNCCHASSENVTK